MTATLEPAPLSEVLPDLVGLKHITAVKEAQLARLVAEERWADLCPANPAVCKGERRIALPGYGEGHLLLCPLLDQPSCPAHANRRLEADRNFLEALYYGEQRELMAATREELTVSLRPSVDLWCATAGERLRRGEGLILSGGRGTGKSSTCTLLALAARAADATCCFVESWQAFDELHRQDYARLVWDAQFLFWDDFGMEARSDTGMARFQGLMNRRWSSRLSTVLTTNQSRSELTGDPALGRLFSRLLQRNVWAGSGQEDRRKPIALSDWEVPQ